MKYAPWAAALLVLVVAIVAVSAVVLPQGPLRTSHPSELWGEWTRPLGRSDSPAVTAAPGAPIATSPLQTVYVVEQESPIVSPDDTLGETLGIETPRGKFRAVLPRGTPIRYARSVMFSTGADNQTEIRLHILRGRTESIEGNRSLGWVRIPNLPPGPRRSTQVAVTFQIVDRAIVLVARNVADGRALTIEASEMPPGFGP